MPNVNLAAFQMPLGDAALIAVLGLVIVFIVLAVLVGLLTLFKLIFNIKIDIKKKPKAAPQPEVAVPADKTDDDELVAVITAAIACISEQEQASAPFRIKSIRKLK